MNLFLIRHGETDENKNDIIQGWLDTKLNTTGLAQARHAADMFDEPIEVIISSDLTRCAQTAKPFREKFPSVPYLEDARLRERCFGDAQGTHKDQHDWESFWSIRDSVSINNAETLDEFDARVQNFLDDIKTMPYKAVLVVAHGGTINRLLALTDDTYQYQPVQNSKTIKISL